jgi:hypothetical protein
MCLSSVYKEQALGEVEIDIVYLNGWVAVFQSLFSIPLCVPSSYAISLPINQILPNMYGGMLCWMGINSITNNDIIGIYPDQCEMAPLYVTLYIFFNVIFNFLIVTILKHGSANILWMASTVIVPLSNVAFSLDFMPGHKPLQFMDILGLVVIMLGLVIYRFMSTIWDLLSEYEFSAMFMTVEEKEQERINRRNEKINRLLSKRIEQKQPNYVGFNQIESLQAVIDTRILRETKNKNLFRTTNQIRGNLLLKLGIPPSPQITMSQPFQILGRPNIICLKNL